VPSITVSNDFFRREKNHLYGNWRMAFWRELFQNSVDAGSTEIHISYSWVKTKDKEHSWGNDEGRAEISFADNGHGMTQDVLENVYYVLGKTTKNDGSTVGGFARARILTNFAMDEYQIHTLDNLVKGSGSHYDITKTDFYQGCIQTIWNSEDDSGSLPVTLMEYLARCDMRHPTTGESVRIFFNGDEIHTRCIAGRAYREMLDEMDFLRERFSGEVWATLYEGTKHDTGNMVHIRAHGNEMFSISTTTERSYILELEPSRSREVLSASRDNLKNAFQSILNKFIQKMVSDEEEARNPPKTIEERFYEGTGWTKTAKAGGDDIHVMTRQEAEAKGFSLNTLIGELQGDWRLIYSKEFHERGGQYESTEEGYKVPVKHLVPATPMLIQGTNPKLWQLADQYDPNNWFININGNMVHTGKWINNFNLLAMWKEACRLAMQVIVDHEIADKSVLWCAGFVISDDPDTVALNLRDWGYHEVNGEQTYDEAYRLMLNPLDEDLLPKYKLGKAEHLRKILAAAAHEVCHCFHHDHTASFAALLTEFLEKHVQADMLSSMRAARF